MRIAAAHYQDPPYQALMSKIPKMDSSDRSLLLRPNMAESKLAQR